VLYISYVLFVLYVLYVFVLYVLYVFVLYVWYVFVEDSGRLIYCMNTTNTIDIVISGPSSSVVDMLYSLYVFVEDCAIFILIEMCSCVCLCHYLVVFVVLVEDSARFIFIATKHMSM